MIKYFCDCCSKETERKDLNQFSYKCHLSREHSLTGYCDSEGNTISGRIDSIELCNRCYNKIVSKAVDEYNKLKGEQ